MFIIRKEFRMVQGGRWIGRSLSSETEMKSSIGLCERPVTIDDCEK